jgi:endonuclease/exonuclease/phosphatase family metal-dependent hydrolase
MTASNSIDIRLVTHNVRYAATSLFRGEKPWSERAPQLIAGLNFATTSSSTAFICLQEVLYPQLKDIVAGLNSDNKSKWAYQGVGRDDGKKAGEFSPILYQTASYKLISFKTRWLSDTPDRPSLGWDAACVRILSVGVFEHIASGKWITVLCTHFDHVGTVARRNSAKLIIKQVNSTLATQPMPILLAGDFNSEPSEDAYQLLNNSSSPIQDSQSFTPARLRYGSEFTFTGFDSKVKPTARIDFVFLDRSTKWVAKSYAVLDNLNDGVFCSDHRAVIVDVVV